MLTVGASATVLLCLGACRSAGPGPAVHDKPGRVVAAAALEPFEKDGRWGFRDARGRTVIPPRYVMARQFSDQGIAAVVDDQGWAYIDGRGEVLVRPFLFDNGPDYFREGLARHVDGDKIGFFDESGRVVIPARFDFAGPFSEGLAAVCRGCREVKEGEHSTLAGGRWGYIDRAGKQVIPFEYERASTFDRTGARVRAGGREFSIDRQGREVGGP